MRENGSQRARDEGAWGALVQGQELERLGRGQVLYAPDQRAGELLLLTSGRVGLYLLSSGQRTLMLCEIEPGHIFGHMALIDTAMYDTFAETLGASTFYRVPRAALLQLITQNSSLALALLDDLGQYQELVSRRIDEVAFKSVPARLATLLLDMARGHDAAAQNHVPRRSHRQLAEMINAYRETVTKVMNQFRAARLLEIDGSGFTLVNLTRLEELAQGW